MSKIVFENGSTIEINNSNDNIRGHRATIIDPFYYESYAKFDKETFDEVISKFLNKEEVT